MFNPDATVRQVAIAGHHPCVLVDNILLEPDKMVAFAEARRAAFANEGDTMVGPRRVNPDGEGIGASVLYLFKDSALGGTSFYAPKKSPGDIAALIEQAMTVSGAAFDAIIKAPRPSSAPAMTTLSKCAAFRPPTTAPSSMMAPFSTRPRSTRPTV